ncbi:MAG: hypothetical protein ABIJ04_00475 [Bacteroidota bacterium]
MKSRYATALTIAMFTLFLVFSTGCRKEFVIIDPRPGPDNPLELVVNNTFDWKTSRNITLVVTGLQVPVSIRNTLQVKSTNEEKVYLRNQLFMNRNYTLKFTIPAYDTAVIITYGSIRKTVDATPEVIYFNYHLQ